MINFLEDKVKDMTDSLFQLGLIRGRQSQSIDGIIHKLMAKNIDSEDFKNTPAVYYMNDDINSNLLKKIGYTLALVKRILNGEDRGYSNDNIEPAFSPNMLTEEESNVFYKQILDTMCSLIKCDDTNIVKPAFKKYLELLFNEQAHYFGAQIRVIFMQLVEMILKLKFMSESGNVIENYAEFFSYDTSNIEEQVVEHTLNELAIAKEAISSVLNVEQARKYIQDNNMSRSQIISGTMSWAPAFIGTRGYNSGNAMAPFDKEPLPDFIHQSFLDKNVDNGKEKFINTKPLIFSYVMGLPIHENVSNLIQLKDRSGPLFSRASLESGDSYLPGGGFTEEELRPSREYTPTIVSFIVGCLFHSSYSSNAYNYGTILG